MSWTLAKGLIQLRNQINSMFPDRSKVSDGTIGDVAHSNRKSDHNPNLQKVVCAFDVTHDPTNGVDCNKLAKILFDSEDERIKYIIWNRGITNKEKSGWIPYNGANPHNKHLHISVHSENDSSAVWKLN
jgi:hypothetical protein